MEDYLHAHIPLSAAMEAHVVSVEPDGVTLTAPLAPNLNHRSTAFGGSVATLAILAGWTAVHLGLHRSDLNAHTVIQRSDVTYLEPVIHDFEARVRPLDPAGWRRMSRALARWGRGRIPVTVDVTSEGATVARLQADYVVLAGPED